MHEILDTGNEPLRPRIKRDLLLARTADIALGQFFLPEFVAISQEATHLRKLRLLIGSNAERHDLADILETQARLDTVHQALDAERLAGRTELSQRVGRLAESMRRAIGRMTQSRADARTIESLLHLLEEGRQLLFSTLIMSYLNHDRRVKKGNFEQKSVSECMHIKHSKAYLFILTSFS